MTPPPAAPRTAQRNSGSLIMTIIGVAVGTPLGLLRAPISPNTGAMGSLRLSSVSSTTSCSAPVDRDRSVHLRGRRGADGPFLRDRRVDRPGGPGGSGRRSHHEDMLNLVPNSLREAARARMRVRWSFSASATGRASGLLTGMLLAVARISGETAPLLFTSLTPVLELEPQCADVELAGGDFPVCAQSYKDGNSSLGPAL